MGYTTDFYGQIDIEPPLNEAEAKFLTEFSESRRMHRHSGPYTNGGPWYGGQEEKDVVDHNRPHPGQPGLWCQWVPSSDGSSIVWDGGEKFYNSAEWMKYIIDHFLRNGAHAVNIVPGIVGGHTCNGTIECQGEDHDDHWFIIVRNNAVSTAAAIHQMGEETPL